MSRNGLNGLNGLLGKDILLPAIIGLGFYAQTCEINLANNTTMLLLFYILFQDHEEIGALSARVEELEREEYCEHHYPNGNGHNGNGLNGYYPNGNGFVPFNNGCYNGCYPYNGCCCEYRRPR